MAGAHLAYALALRGTKALVLEAGPRRSRATLVDTFYRSVSKTAQSPYPSVPWAPHPGENQADYYVQTGPDRFIGAYVRIYGGTTWHWTGLADRLRVTDFRMRTLYGVGEDWPISYQDLEPYYERAEQAWGVSGDPAFTWGAPRRGPYPLPPVPETYLDTVVARGLAKVGLKSALFSHARNSVFFDGRPACCGNNTCVPLCPIGAKYDAKSPSPLHIRSPRKSRSQRRSITFCGTLWTRDVRVLAKRPAIATMNRKKRSTKSVTPSVEPASACVISEMPMLADFWRLAIHRPLRNPSVWERFAYCEHTGLLVNDAIHNDPTAQNEGLVLT
jgi:choline dehydrogenase-like flavoprotein